MRAGSPRSTLLVLVLLVSVAVAVVAGAGGKRPTASPHHELPLASAVRPIVAALLPARVDPTPDRLGELRGPKHRSAGLLAGYLALVLVAAGLGAVGRLGLGAASPLIPSGAHRANGSRAPPGAAVANL